MLDAHLRRLIDPPFAAAASQLSTRSVSANALTLAAFASGLTAFGCVATHRPLAGLVLLALNRALAGLGRAMARLTVSTDIRVYLDLVLDFLFGASMPLAFALADPSRALAGAFLILALASAGTIFLVSDALMFRSGLPDSRSDHVTLGAAMFVAFALACLVPAWFSAIAYVFGVLCFIAVGARVANVVERLK
jgi:phosphatidylglycerophosphate synthase